MPKSRRRAAVVHLVRDIDAQLVLFEAALPDLSLREKVLRLVALQESFRDLGVTTEELAYVAKDTRSFQRRVRELRTEHGYSIATRFTGRADLSAGQYVLQSAEPLHEPHDRRIPEDVRRRVFERDGSTCCACGWNAASAAHPGERYFSAVLSSSMPIGVMGSM